MTHSPRPLSPHLQIYRPQITSTMSIFHRFAGVILMSVPFLLVVALTTVTHSQECYTQFWQFMSHPIGQIYSFVVCLSFYYHACHGLRHLMWDAGYGFDLKVVRWTGWLAQAIAVIATIVTWLVLKGF